MHMRFVLRVLFFAGGFLAGGEALRRWLEKEEARSSGEDRHLRAVPQPQRPAAVPKPTPAPAPKPPPPAPHTDKDASRMSKAELYERAKQLGVEGRSKLSKAELADAVRRAEAEA